MMAPRAQQGEVAEVEPTNLEVTLISDAKLLQDFAAMAMAIPADEGNVVEDILRQVLQAKTWDDLDKPWDTEDIKDIVNRPMRVIKVKKQKSRYAGGLGLFLVVTLVDIKTGEQKVKTTGALSVVAQLTRAYFLGVTAMTVIWRESEPNQETGFKAQHLEIVDGHTPVKPGN